MTTVKLELDEFAVYQLLDSLQNNMIFTVIQDSVRIEFKASKHKQVTYRKIFDRLKRREERGLLDHRSNTGITDPE